MDASGEIAGGGEAHNAHPLHRLSVVRPGRVRSLGGPAALVGAGPGATCTYGTGTVVAGRDRPCDLRLYRTGAGARGCRARAAGRHRNGHTGRRSEEHTAELQSLMRISYAVFFLKKK